MSTQHTVCTGDRTLHTPCIQNLHFTRMTFILFYTPGPPESPTYPSFNRATSTSPPSRPLGGPPPRFSSTHQKTAIHLRVGWQEVGHFHMELYQIVLLLRYFSLTHTCTHSPSIALFVRLHPSSWSGGESRFKSPKWITPLSSFAIQTFFSPHCFHYNCKWWKKKSYFVFSFVDLSAASFSPTLELFKSSALICLVA